MLHLGKRGEGAGAYQHEIDKAAVFCYIEPNQDWGLGKGGVDPWQS